MGQDGGEETAMTIILNDGALIIIKPIVKTAGGYSDFNEYRDVVKSNLIDQKYDGLIDRLVKEAQIEIKDDVYRQLKF